MQIPYLDLLQPEAIADLTLGSKGEISQEETPANESEDKQDELNLTLTETSTDDVQAINDRMRDLEKNHEEKVSIDISESTCVEDNQMEVTPDPNITN